MAIPDDVVELMLTKVSRLPAETQEVLQLAAALGNQFTLEDLAVVSDNSYVKTYHLLQPALQAMMVQTVSGLELRHAADRPGRDSAAGPGVGADGSISDSDSDSGSESGASDHVSPLFRSAATGAPAAAAAAAAATTTDDDDPSPVLRSPSASSQGSLMSNGSQLVSRVTSRRNMLVHRSFRFLHDRVQQAAYRVKPPEELPAVHLGIARVLHDRWSPATIEARIFMLVEHYNLGAPGLRDIDEVVLCVELNSMAARKALQSAAYLAGTRFSTHLQKLLTEFSTDARDVLWAEHYDMMLEAHLTGIEVHQCCKLFDESEALVHETVARATTPVCKGRALYKLVIQSKSLFLPFFTPVACCLYTATASLRTQPRVCTCVCAVSPS